MSFLDPLIGEAWVINLLLVFLVILDIVLSLIASRFPATWFRLFHGRDYEDPVGLLTRTGSVWVTFTLLQFLAFFMWQQQPWWLVLIAGVRLTELFADLTYLWINLRAKRMTLWGSLGLFIAPPGNLLMGWYLIRSYLDLVSVSP